MLERKRWVLRLALLGITILAAGCIHIFWRTEVQRVDYATPTSIKTPLKVHMADGSTVLFRSGGIVDNTRITGSGQRYALNAGMARAIDHVPLDSVVGVETFKGKAMVGTSIVVSAAATAVGAAATVVALIAIFGSCPTLYADTGSTAPLQAEGFSYAIAPLLEQRDVDPLRITPDANGVIRLELRNEALETHFINHIELLAATHAADARVMPDQSNRLVAVRGVRPFDSARDRANRDVSASIATADGTLFSTAPAIVDAAREGDLDDWIDLDASNLPPSDSIVVALRLRNSLLNTVLLYEGLLGGRDAADWMETDLQRISTAIDLSHWYTRTMGLRATVDGLPLAPAQAYHTRLGDVGPIAFRDVALVLPRASRDGRVRVRLRFVADNWRIDQVGLASSYTRPASTKLAIDRIVVPQPATGGRPIVDTAAMHAIRESDGLYLETNPGQRMTLEYRAPKTGAAKRTTYLVAWQGYYREWIRGAWLAQPTRFEPWKPGDAAMVTAIKRWRAQQTELERAFYSSRIPVQ
jgi:hypothetical protein